MLRVLAWMGLYIGTPSVVTWGTITVNEPFMLFFALSVFAVLLAVLPHLGETTRH